MGWLDRLLNRRREEALPLYEAVVARARAPHWYLDGAVPDTTDGRFDMVVAVLATVLLRLEQDPAGALASAQVTERFVDDMDAQLRQAGIGDIVVGKRIGKMMAMLGGRLGAYRDGWAAGDIRPALSRNLYREELTEAQALEHVAAELAGLRQSLAALSTADVAAGRLA
ncbi:MAG: ubiquinol-cytochrome chaperone [Sphingomonas bacterium]|uniref:ubiquinol-cytochrome C chaperone family protein n=1 Tax=Sphingomonas bacterium TaxID=1895847 RepID=UPI002601CCE6|nr:ubiquinol-cytochrome C chaperone family protein [Sphingomonas bacterium]MDB5695730.1 ubiquinol-cytochrome chaperone [Sphingomonas bacterium]